jgi:hypothetical protein
MDSAQPDTAIIAAISAFAWKGINDTADEIIEIIFLLSPKIIRPCKQGLIFRSYNYYFLAAFLRRRRLAGLAAPIADLDLRFDLRFLAGAALRVLRLAVFRALRFVATFFALRRFGFAAFTTFLLLLAMTSFLPIVNNTIINLTLAFIKV